MNNKEALLRAASELIEERGDRLNEITVREICERAGVGLGLLNYHFGSKDNLLKLCVERIINKIVDRFRQMREEIPEMDPFERLVRLGNLTLDFLFSHSVIARISILQDMENPKSDDNTHRTFAAYVPLVAECRPDWDEETLKRRTYYLITVMQQMFLRSQAVSCMLGLDLMKEDVRREFHAAVLKDILEM